MNRNIDLQYAIDNGIIDLPNIQSIIEMTKRQELLNKHPYKIWYGTDNKWHTYLPDEEKGRVPRKRNSKEEIENVIIEYWKEKEENPTIKELFYQWNNNLLKNNLIKTNTACRNESCFKRHYSEFGEKRIKDTDLDMWVEFLEEQIPKYNLSAKSFAGLKTISKGILKLSKRKKYIDFTAQDVIEDLISRHSDYKTPRNVDYIVFLESFFFIISYKVSNRVSRLNSFVL